MNQDQFYQIRSGRGPQMVSSDSGAKFVSVVLTLLVLIPFVVLGVVNENPFLFVVGLVVSLTAGSFVRINNEWEKGIIFRLGRYNRTSGSGLYLILPFLETVITRDMRVRTVDIPTQEVITKDNISVKVDAVVFLKIIDAKKSIVNIQNFMYAVRQFSQTTLRNVIGQKNLDELLEKRREIARSIKETVDEEAGVWGVDVTKIELQNIELPENMKRVMARQAEAERERRAVVIKSKGEVEAAENLQRAANLLMKSKEGVALRLREFETISDISYDQSNTIVFYPSGLGKGIIFKDGSSPESGEK